jgi:hypothetical protein
LCLADFEGRPEWVFALAREAADAIEEADRLNERLTRAYCDSSLPEARFGAALAALAGAAERKPARRPMSNPTTPPQEVEELKPCPFCGVPLTIRHWSGRCNTDGCWMSERRTAVPLDDPKQVAAWNTRTPPPPKERGEGRWDRLERARLIAADTAGLGGGTRELFLGGDADDHLYVRIALAALQPPAGLRDAVLEEAAKVAEQMFGQETPTCYHAGEQIAAAIRTLASSPSPWQPIETAPKDGRYLLLSRNCGVPFIGRWHKLRADDGVWLGHDDVDVEPDHWMALPQPPEPSHDR